MAGWNVAKHPPDEDMLRLCGAMKEWLGTTSGTQRQGVEDAGNPVISSRCSSSEPLRLSPHTIQARQLSRARWTTRPISWTLSCDPRLLILWRNERALRPSTSRQWRPNSPEGMRQCLISPPLVKLLCSVSNQRPVLVSSWMPCDPWQPWKILSPWSRPVAALHGTSVTLTLWRRRQ